MPILVAGMTLSFSCLLINNKWIVLAFMLLIYPLIGAGYNTLAQIYFQKNTDRDDIPSLRGIYNIMCGLAVLSSGLVSPLLLNDLSVFYMAIGLLFALSMIFLRKQAIQ